MALIARLHYKSEFLKSIGDELKFFFDEDLMSTKSLSYIFQCTIEMERCLRKLENQFDMKSPLSFRAFLLYGSVSLAWNPTGNGGREADFHGDLMIDTKRFLDAERELEITQTCLLIEKGTWLRLKQDNFTDVVFD